MNVTYTGKIELIGTQTDNVEAKFAKLSKLLERRGEKQAHVILDHFKGQHRAEITMNYLDHTLVGQHEDPDQFTAINAAIDKLEKQALRLRQRRREGKKGPRVVRSLEPKTEPAVTTPPRSANAPVNGKGRVFRVAEQEDRKPMTLEEAILEIERDGDYCVFRDAATDRLSVLLRRSDGNFDLIES
jgi:putative sigma-54 modulation protein